jgi:hypothetical protein
MIRKSGNRFSEKIMLGDQIFPVMTTIVVRDDPAQASAAA